jgi:hypothetical protein
MVIGGGASALTFVLQHESARTENGRPRPPVLDEQEA